MDSLINKIQHTSLHELQQIMDEIEDRYAVLYPDWDTIYVAVHKDPILRREELAQIISQIEKEMGATR